MAIRERDAVTGRETTGHEWDGIKELNTPLPKWWLYTFYATIVFSVIYWVLFPSIPWISGHTDGILGYNQRVALDKALGAAAESQAQYVKRIEQAPSLADIQADPDLLNFAMAGGRATFNENCAPCHGLGGSGRPGGFPTLADDDWLWGGTLDEVAQTIRHGIRNADPDSRQSVMPNFGTDAILDNAQIADVAEYVLSLSGRSTDAAAADRGKPLFADNCAACHGDKGQGLPEFGAPNLTDAIWLYGDGSKAAIIAQVTQPKMGVMPSWQGRLTEAQQRMVAVYVHSLGGGQ
ncbi:MAG: cytochrome-c oxidase, cbb3-type subunit III [Pseudomonadota bacterium]